MIQVFGKRLPLKSNDFLWLNHLMDFDYISQVELVINRKIWVTILMEKTVIICQVRVVIIGQMVSAFVNGPGNQGSIPGQVIPKILWCFLAYKVWIKSKRSNPGKGVVASSTPPCCSYWKGSLRVDLDYCWSTYSLSLSIYIYIYIYIQKIEGFLTTLYMPKQNTPILEEASFWGIWCSFLT